MESNNDSHPAIEYIVGDGDPLRDCSSEMSDNELSANTCNLQWGMNLNTKSSHTNTYIVMVNLIGFIVVISQSMIAVQGILPKRGHSP